MINDMTLSEIFLYLAPSKEDNLNAHYEAMERKEKLAAASPRERIAILRATLPK